MAVTENAAIQAISQEVGEQFNTLVNIMNDLADNGYLDGFENRGAEGVYTEGSEIWCQDLGEGRYGYSMGGVELETGHWEGDRAVNDPKDATSPAMALALASATSNQQLYTGQLGDLANKASQIKRNMNQVANR